MGIFQKTANFLGISKFGEGLASAGRVISGSVDKDREIQQQADNSVQKILYAAKQEKDPARKTQLLNLVKNLGGSVQESEIDPGLNLTNKEVLGSAANVVLNVATPGAFKGSKAAIIGKNALLGGAFGAAQGLEKNRSTSGIIGSTVGGAVIGGAIGGIGLMAKAAKEFLGNKVPEWMMNKAVKPALSDLKKNVKFGSETLGKQLLDEGVKGGPKKLLEIADSQQTKLESELQGVLNEAHLQGKIIERKQVAPFVRELIKQKKPVPGSAGDIQAIKDIYYSMPEKMTLQEANNMKRAIYQELRDTSYKLDAKLGSKAAVLKNIAKGLKTAIEEAVGGDTVKTINQKLSIYGRLENAMVDQLARDMRNNGVGLTDAILLAGGGHTGVLALLRHLGQGAETYAAQGLSKVSEFGTGVVGRTAKNLAKRALLNAP